MLAPILMVGGYLAADFFDSQNSAGEQVYPLELVEVCNLATTPCRFRISEFTATLSATGSSSGSQLTLETSESIQAVNLELLGRGSTMAPKAMNPDAGNVNRWHLGSEIPLAELHEVHMVISTGKVFLLGDARW